MDGYEAPAWWRKHQEQTLKDENFEQRCLDFVKGAKWWEWIKTNATMWQSDQHAAYEAAKLLFGQSKEPWPPEYRPDSLDAERYRKLKAAMEARCRTLDGSGFSFFIFGNQTYASFDAAVDALPEPAREEK